MKCIQHWRSRRASSGQALVETAILVPMLLVFALGITEMGRAAYTAIMVSNSAHAGALYGSQDNTKASDFAGMQQAALSDGQGLTGLTATATHVCKCATGADAPDCTLADCATSRLLEYAQVDTSAVFTPLCAIPGLPGSFTLTGHALVVVRP